eukprot:Lithocolla_globosa_v1_NODE_82_length_6720_cov_15.294779.p1 type:complete len:1901 gc:universal NODE_82_length_6720_cov_15.294779:819-6521(+)
MVKINCKKVEEKGYCYNFQQGKCTYVHKPCPWQSECNKERCQLNHPNVLCKTSGCTGGSCTNRHPAKKPDCKQAERCLRISCPYEHPEWMTPCPQSESCSDLLCRQRHPLFGLDTFLFERNEPPGTLRQTQLSKLQKLIKNALTKHELLISTERKAAFNCKTKLRASRDSSGVVEQELNDTYLRCQESLQELLGQKKVFCLCVQRCIVSTDILSPQLRYQLKRETYRLQNRLPALAKRLEVEQCLKESQYLVIKGHTGSGKSTQIPAYLLDSIEFSGKKIICTQPRKIAATSLAERVTIEYVAGYKETTTVGGTIGYRTGTIRKTNKSTRLEYVTEASFLTQLLSNKMNYQDLGAVVVDEAHERNVVTDILIGVLKTEIAPKYPHLKVIVTSATLDTQLFTSYLHQCPLVEIPGRTFPVDIKYVVTDPGMLKETNIVTSVVEQALVIHQTTPPTSGDILCFLTGQEDVERACQMFNQKADTSSLHMSFGLYGKQTPEEQQEAFAPQPSGVRKVLFATDVAETSITIDGIRHVVDCGLTKDNVFDPKRNVSSLKIVPISQSSATQRKGRAGRTCSGTCYRLYSEDEFESMRVSVVPEVQRRPLSLVVINLIMMKLDPMTFEWLEPPAKDAVTTALLELKRLGALENDGKKLTKLGKLMSELQLEPSFTCLLYHGWQKGMSQVSTSLVGVLSVASMFFWRGGDEESKKNADVAKMKLADEGGDVVTMYRVMEKWQEVIKSTNNIKSKNEETKQKLTQQQIEALQVYLTEEKEKQADQFIIEQGSIDESKDDNDSMNTSEKLSDISESDRYSEVSQALSDDTTSQPTDDARLSMLATKQILNNSNRKVVREWCKTNFLNHKALGMAFSTKCELEKSLRKLGFWNSGGLEDQTTVTNQQLNKLLLNGFCLQVACLTRQNQYQAALMEATGVIHPGSVMSRNKNLKWVMYHSILRTSRSFLLQVMPFELEWLQEEVPSVYELVKESISEMRMTCVQETVPVSIQRLILGKFNTNLDQLEQEWNCSLDANFDQALLSAWCKPELENKVSQSLQAAITTVREAMITEVIEEPLIGSTRVVYGLGGRIHCLLFQSEYLAINVRNLPSGYREKDLKNWFSKYGTIRGCSITPTSDSTGWGHIVFDSINQATRARAETFGEFAPGGNNDKIVTVTPGGLRQPAMFRDVECHLEISWSLAKSMGEGRLGYSTAQEANSLLEMSHSVFPNSVKLFPFGDRPLPPVGHRDYAKVIAKQEKNKNLPARPELDSEGKFFKLQQTNHHSIYVISIKGLSLRDDEFQIRDYLSRLHASSIRNPKFVSILRKPEINKTIETEASLLQDSIEMQEMIPFMKEQEPTITTFTDTKNYRGGAKVFYTKGEIVTSALPIVQERVKFHPHSYQQPWRVEAKVSCALAIHIALWKRFYTKIQQGVLIPAQTQGRVKIIINNKDPNRITLRLESNSMEALNHIKQKLDSVLKCLLFKHHHKSLLFSQVGRARMQKISDLKAYLHWDNATRTLRIYGNEQEKNQAEKALIQIIQTLENLKLDHSILIKKPSRRIVEELVPQLRKVEGIEDLSFKGGARIQASGTTNAIEELQSLLNQHMVQPRSLSQVKNENNFTTDQECGLCFSELTREEKPYTLQACGHRYCLDCIQNMFASAENGDAQVPYCCPACQKELVLRDISTLTTPQAFEKVKEAALLLFKQRHVETLTECPGQGCCQVLKRPTSSLSLPNQNLPLTEAELLKDGGEVAHCDQCLRSYCLKCSEETSTLTESHPGYRCGKQCDELPKDVQIQLNYILETILNLRCPRCRTVFFDFDGCLALYCGNNSCKAGFCALCLKDEGEDAHQHVLKCPLHPTSGYFLPIEDWKRFQQKRQISELKKYFLSLPNDLQEQLRPLLNPHIEEYGLLL